MKVFQLCIVASLWAALSWQPTDAQVLDPSFAPNSIYAPGIVYTAVEQPDGQRVVAGAFTRVNGSTASGVARLNANGVLDAAFQQNVGPASRTYRPRLLPNGQILLISLGGTITAGGLTRESVLRLNANGTGDATFNAGSGAVSTGNTIYVDDILPLPNGKMVVVGPFDTFNGTPASRIVRLTATGAVDPTFNAGSGADREIEIIVGLPNGQMLIGGYFDTYNGQPANGLARLNADGSLDATFVTTFTTQSEAINLLVQPDGKILVAGAIHTSNGPSGAGLVRLLPSGALDPIFFAPSSLVEYSVYSLFGDVLQLQADGRILYASTAQGPSRIGRLNTNGSEDTSFSTVTTNGPLYSLTLLANGSILVGGNSIMRTAGLDNHPLVQFTSNGTLDTSFQPLIQTTGSVNDVVRQADGKLIVGGLFSEINGQAANGLARFNPNGSLDGNFAPALGATNVRVTDLALQADGSLLAATGATVVRYLSTGALDNTFDASALRIRPTRVLVQPNGRILVANFSSAAGTTGPNLVRLLVNGTPDATFSTLATGPGSNNSVHAVELLADGKILVAGSFRASSGNSLLNTIMRLESTGTQDLSFVGSAFSGANTTSGLNSLAVQPDGKILVGGRFSGYGSTSRTNVLRLNPDGSLDGDFVPPSTSGTVNKLLLQPNNRVLLGGLFTGGGLPANLARLLPNGTADASFETTATPDGTVNSLLLQPNGAIVLGGFFGTVGGQPRAALARITAPAVLHMAAPRAVAARTQAWPVPAHSALTVAPDASAHPQAVEMLDLLGRPVLQQVLTGTAPVVLPLETLSTGTYLLRVTYAEGTVVRRVQVQ
ncbi:T9SS type A sorting domain-containing protein [Hymenobacter sp. IS2118]|uniref:T9SS type A sorting domain-containing protein n=1 Tax=Hymenobacter sp. IS2118 TaxID=1505605 RepID=UPI0005517ACC|nr:T9SS type A sorting domain-containing protein [Hymenobacter sp. IS2118]